MVVSEFARGGSLEQWLAANGGMAPSPNAALEMISGILSGLEHLHRLHIIHRDLKPANILLQGERPRLADFGLARVLKSSNFSQTVAGTPEYMAPEAFANDRSEQADLWAVGVMLYQMLAGRLPFPFSHGMSPLQKMAIITNQEVLLLPGHISGRLREVVFICLRKKPEERYPAAADMLAALADAADSLKFKARQLTALHPVSEGVPAVQSRATATIELPVIPPAEPAPDEATTVVEMSDGRVVEIRAEAQEKMVSAVESDMRERRREPDSSTKDGKAHPGETALRESNALFSRNIQGGGRKLGRFQATIKLLWSIFAATREILLPVLIVALIAAGLVLVAKYLNNLGKVDSSAGSDVAGQQTKSGSTTHSAGADIPVNVAEYYLELEHAGGKTVRATTQERVRPNQKYKLHFIPREYGYLYVIAPGATGTQTTYLTAKSIPRTGVKSNAVEAGKDFEFPASDNWMVVPPDRKTTDVTVVFSTSQLQKPEFLAAPAGRNLTESEYRELLSSAQNASTLVSGDHLLVRVSPMASGDRPNPIIFNIILTKEGK